MLGQGCHPVAVMISLSLYDRIGIIILLLAVWWVYWYIVHLPDDDDDNEGET
jgi:hypothetical protein